MRNSAGYILLLALGIGGAGGYAYVDSELITVRVVDKDIRDGRSRRGVTATNYVIATDAGEFTISEFPFLGYAFSAAETYRSLGVGDRITIRVGSIPPAFGENKHHTQIFDIVR